MNPEQVKQLLLDQLPGSEVTVGVDGSHFNLVIVGDQFEGLRAVQRQQKVYAALSEQIASGIIHAVNIKAYTTEEWAQRS